MKGNGRVVPVGEGAKHFDPRSPLTSSASSVHGQTGLRSDLEAQGEGRHLPSNGDQAETRAVSSSTTTTNPPLPLKPSHPPAKLAHRSNRLLKMTIPRSPRSFDLSFDCSSSSSSASTRSVSSSSSAAYPHPPTYSDAIDGSTSYQFPARCSTPLPAYPAPSPSRALPSRSPLPTYSPDSPALPLGLSPRAHWELTANPRPTQATNALSAALAAQVEREITDREERRIRQKLEPLLFPAPRGLGEMMKGLTGAGKKERKEEKERRRREAEGLSEREKEIAQRMVKEEWERMNEAA